MRNAFAVNLSQDGKTALVADLYHGVTVVDLTNPLDPQALQQIKTRRATQGLSLSHDQKTAYVADTQAGLTVIRFR